MRAHRFLALLTGIGVASALAACGSSTTSSTTTAPRVTTVPASSPAVSPTSTGAVTSTTSPGAQNLVATAADKTALTTAFVAYKQISSDEITGTDPGTVYYAFVPATHTYWALASFLPSSSASQQTLVGLQDGGRTGIFTRQPGGSWTVVATGSVPFCPSQTVIPATVRAVWGLTDPTACTMSG